MNWISASPTAPRNDGAVSSRGRRPWRSRVGVVTASPKGAAVQGFVGCAGFWMNWIAASATPPDETTGETTSHLTRLSNNDSQVIGYSHSTKPASWQVAGYRNDCLFGSGSSGLSLLHRTDPHP